MLHSRWMPAIAPGAGDALAELVVLRSTDVELGPVYTGSFTLALHDAPGEELASLAPIEPIAGYWRQVGATFVGGERVG
jgi:acetoacetate decarboxylase